MNPPRQSVFNNGDFQKLISQADGYVETLSAMVGNSFIEFTPHEKIQEMNLIWSRAIRRMVLDSQTPVDEVLGYLKKEIDSLLVE
ncbi:MAG: hypothetical protein JXA95_09130 [Spirochaetales bacterium]|nr:hypothetical protein [Spirochaetales bacterium]